MTQQRADATMNAVEGWGINHIDTAASYGDSEIRLRPWLASRRDEVFLATKTGERNGTAARAELERSLERMDVESVDLIQLHNLVDPDGWETAFASGGAVEALAAARDEGLVRHVGITGHGVPVAAMHLRSLERFDFDSVLLPINFVMMDNPRYRHDVEQLLDVCGERSVAVQTIKSIARGAWADGNTARFSWYDPLTDPEPIARAVRFVLSHPQMFLNTTSDARLLPHVIFAAEGDLSMPSEVEMRADVAAEGITPLFTDDEPVPI
jgi:aryl-alcohol dehydrogenase-like predicted oxidoreductase